MAAVTTKPCCVSCGKEIPVLKCAACLQAGNNIEEKHALIQQVNDWECNSINEIRQTADEARKLIHKRTTDRIAQVKDRITQLTEQLHPPYVTSNFVPENVSKWQEELIQLSKQLTVPISIKVRQVSSPLITKILVDLPGTGTIPDIGANAIWIPNGTTVAGGNGGGNGLNQLYNPWGIYVDDDQTIYVVDRSAHRVVEWKNGEANGLVVAGGNGGGNQANQLNSPLAVLIDKETDSLIIADYNNKRVVRWPRRNGATGRTIIADVTCYCGLAMDTYGYLYVADYAKHEVKRWKIGDANGIVVAGGNGTGNRLDQLSSRMFLFVDQDHSVYISDTGNHRVTKWTEGAKEGVVVAGGQGAGSGLTQLSNPRGVVVDQLGTVYVADQSNHRVVRWPKGAAQGSVVADGTGVGTQPNQFNSCFGLAFDQKNNLYVSDYGSHRVQRFSIDPNSV